MRLKSLPSLKEFLSLAKVSILKNNICLTVFKSVISERSYFMLDTELDLVHFFKNTKDYKPY